MKIETPAAAAVAPSPRTVPKFGSSLRGRIEMDPQQRAFYLEEFLPGLLAGKPVDVQGNSGYTGELIFELIEQRLTESGVAKERLLALMEAYGWMDLPYFAKRVRADFYFLEGDFVSGYAALGNWNDTSFYLTLSESFGHPRLTARDIFRWADPGSITRKGVGYILRAFDALQVRLDEFHAVHGVSIVEDFWRRLSAEGTVDKVAVCIEDEVTQRYTGEEVRFLIARGRGNHGAAEPAKAFGEWPQFEEVIDWPSPWAGSRRYNGLIWARCRVLMREAENAAREAAEIPRVGEGWVSEMELLRAIEASFPDERVIHQARPSWLAPQSLDIYLSDHNIAIEYQGAQHSRPVEHFGGQEAFERQQERDLRKQATCQQNGCTLIAVHPGYRLEDVVAQVRVAIEERRG